MCPLSRYNRSGASEPSGRRCPWRWAGVQADERASSSCGCGCGDGPSRSPEGSRWSRCRPCRRHASARSSQSRSSYDSVGRDSADSPAGAFHSAEAAGSTSPHNARQTPTSLIRSRRRREPAVPPGCRAGTMAPQCCRCVRLSIGSALRRQPVARATAAAHVLYPQGVRGKPNLVAAAGQSGITRRLVQMSPTRSPIVRWDSIGCRSGRSVRTR